MIEHQASLRKTWSGRLPVRREESGPVSSGKIVVRRCCRRIRFTLVELLIVIVIITMLAALLLPALMRARITAKVVGCTANQKQVGMWGFMYANEYDGILPTTGFRNKSGGLYFYHYIAFTGWWQKAKADLNLPHAGDWHCISSHSSGTPTPAQMQLQADLARSVLACPAASPFYGHRYYAKADFSINRRLGRSGPRYPKLRHLTEKKMWFMDMRRHRWIGGHKAWETSPVIWDNPLTWVPDENKLPWPWVRGLYGPGETGKAIGSYHLFRCNVLYGDGHVEGLKLSTYAAYDAAEREAFHGNAAGGP